MSFSTLINIVTMIFCVAVIVQSFRMMKSLKRVQQADLQQMVAALDASTAKARAVVADMKHTLAVDAAPAARVLTESKAIHEELSVMIGIANAMAERLMDASSQQAAIAPPAVPVDDVLIDDASVAPAAPAKSRRRAAGATDARAPQKPAVKKAPAKKAAAKPSSAARTATAKASAPAASKPAASQPAAKKPARSRAAKNQPAGDAGAGSEPSAVPVSSVTAQPGKPFLVAISSEAA